ncbi:uncharacterized protein LOC120150403 isoform X1 [Hibiscus syriacus]|uniref:uncharacterized protein LOC120150403 isoform X1 n=1 Tax=Hibiscus syriacus TaxID=106335 RepID=UPI0019243902|nr:uncharacterized protein LOC120150403 isoform X1 [Hibiscus syriacus]
MSQTNGVEDVKEKEGMNESEKIQVDDEKYQIFGEEFSVSKELKDEDENENEKNLMPSAREEEEAIKKKYGGFLPKKTTLISKNHDRAFFDSADWALGKVKCSKEHKSLKDHLKHYAPNYSPPHTSKCAQDVLLMHLQQMKMKKLHLPRIKAAHWTGTTIILTLQRRTRLMIMEACMKHDPSPND